MQHRGILPFLILAILMGSILTGPLAAQEPTLVNMTDRAQPFYFEALNFASITESGLEGRVDIYAHIPFNIVQFVKKEEMYYGGYSITAIITNDAGTLMKDLSWDRSLEVLDFERTSNPNVYDLSMQSIALPPGNANIEIVFEDSESARTYRSNRRIEVKAFDADSFGMSDIMLVAKMDYKAGKQQIVPHISPNMAIGTEGFHIYFEAYNPLPLEAVNIVYNIKRLTTPVSRRSDTQPIKQGMNPFVANINSKDFNVGGYSIEVTLRRPGDTASTDMLASSEKSFVLEWVSATGTTVQITDLDQAIDQLQYIADKDVLEKLREAPTENEKRERFEQFWEQHNPVPGAPTNTAMVEYYSRVTYANEHFGNFQDGWRSDRGMVFVMYGPPSATENHPFEADTRPFIIWDYYDLNRRFVFVDNTGFGDYRLLYPIWDDRNRLR